MATLVPTKLPPMTGTLADVTPVTPIIVYLKLTESLPGINTNRYMINSYETQNHN
jgi:hypothetical protein